MSTKELIKALKRRARKDGVTCDVKRHESKGSHRTVYFGDRKTTVPWTSDLTKGALHGILKQLEVKDLFQT